MTNNPTIIIATYNRPYSLKRILQSLSNANYDSDSVRLVISIDGGADNNEEVCKIANEFSWIAGSKKIIKHANNLGLRNHILFCGDLTKEYNNIVLLEDDLFVGPNFYIFAKQALDFYKNENDIAGISLYSYNYNENVKLPFRALKDENSVFFMQVPSSWGQMYSKKQWAGFKEFYKKTPRIEKKDKLPENVKNWPETSWKKYFYKYIVDNNLYIVYPYESHSSNCGDVGVHHLNKMNTLQVPLNFKKPNSRYNFIKIEDSSRVYDAYFELLPKCYASLGIDILEDEDVLIDLYGSKQSEVFNNVTWLTSRKSNSFSAGYECVLFPLEENILRNNNGNDLILAKKKFIDFSSDESGLGCFMGKDRIIKDLNQQKDHIIQQKNKEISNLKKSKSFKIGNLFFRSIEKPWKLITFPINLFRIILEEKIKEK